LGAFFSLSDEVVEISRFLDLSFPPDFKMPGPVKERRFGAETFGKGDKMASEQFHRSRAIFGASFQANIGLESRRMMKIERSLCRL
jgi:hypothetical protein